MDRQFFEYDQHITRYRRKHVHNSQAPEESVEQDMITTRFAKVEDLSTILELIHLKAAFDGFPESVTATSEALERGLFSDFPEAQVLFAEAEGKVIGMASFHRHYSTFIAKPGIWLDDLFIREEHRSQGAGEALMIRLAQICLDLGGARIEWSTAARNALGAKFYERIGSVILQGSRLTRLNEEALKHLVSLPHSARRAKQGASTQPPVAKGPPLGDA